MEGILAGAAAGAAVGFAGTVPVRLLPARIEESLEQPAWTRWAGHPLVLLITGAALVAACAARFGLEPELLPALLLVGLLLPISAIDLAYRVIPNMLVLPGTLVGLRGVGRSSTPIGCPSSPAARRWASRSSSSWP